MIRLSFLGILAAGILLITTPASAFLKCKPDDGRTFRAEGLRWTSQINPNRDEFRIELRSKDQAVIISQNETNELRYIQVQNSGDMIFIGSKNGKIGPYITVHGPNEALKLPFVYSDHLRIGLTMAAFQLVGMCVLD